MHEFARELRRYLLAAFLPMLALLALQLVYVSVSSVVQDNEMGPIPQTVIASLTLLLAAIWISRTRLRNVRPKWIFLLAGIATASAASAIYVLTADSRSDTINNSIQAVVPQRPVYHANEDSVGTADGLIISVPDTSASNDHSGSEPRKKTPPVVPHGHPDRHSSTQPLRANSDHQPPATAFVRDHTSDAPETNVPAPATNSNPGTSGLADTAQPQPEAPLDAAGRLAAIQQRLEAEYRPAVASEDGTDLKAAGAVLKLQKDGLVMSNTNRPIPPINLYRDGEIREAGLSGFLAKLTLPRANDSLAQRRFKAGEQLSVTKIQVGPRWIELQLLSDPYDNIRYRGILRVPFTEGQIPSPDDAALITAQVFKSDTDGASVSTAASVGAGAAAAAAPTHVIQVGESREAVIETFGNPSKVVSLGKKEIFYYSDMKVTFIGGKVANIE